MGTITGKKQGIHHRVIRGLLHVFVPHSGNDFHPHLIRPVGLIGVGLVVGLLYTAATAPHVESIENTELGSMTKAGLLTASNDARVKESIAPLTLNDQLSSAAGLKARDMLVRDYWDHNAPDGTTPWYWYREVNYRYDYAGENLAKGFTTPQAVITAWMNSDEHRQNLLNANYEDVGFGVATGQLGGEMTTIVVAMYGSPIGSSALTSPQVLAATDQEMNLATRFGIGLQSLNPLALFSVVLLLVTAVVSLAAYALRKKVPGYVRQDWRHHKALYKALFTACIIFILITLYGNGQVI